MYTAILKYKNGNSEELPISCFFQTLYIERPTPSKYEVEETVDLTPENIIQVGGFTSIELSSIRKLTFYFQHELPEHKNGNRCFVYYEV